MQARFLVSQATRPFTCNNYLYAGLHGYGKLWDVYACKRRTPQLHCNRQSGMLHGRSERKSCTQQMHFKSVEECQPVQVQRVQLFPVPGSALQQYRSVTLFSVLVLVYISLFPMLYRLRAYSVYIIQCLHRLLEYCQPSRPNDDKMCIQTTHSSDRYRKSVKRLFS